MRTKDLFFIIVVTAMISACTAYAEGPKGLSFFGTPVKDDDMRGSAVKAEDAKTKEAQRLSWFEKQLKIMSLSEKKSMFTEKSVAQVYKRLKDQEEWNKNYTVQRFLEVAKKTEEIGYTVSAYGETLIRQKDGSYIRYFDGKPTDIFFLTEKDNYGNERLVNIMNIEYLDTDDFAKSIDATSTHIMDYIKLTYDPVGAINYLKYEDTEYESNLPDRPSSYTTTEGAVEKTSALDITKPADTESAKIMYDKIVDNIIPAIESALSYTVTTIFSNIRYYTLGENNASANAPGSVYGEKASYDYKLTTTAAPDAPETGTVSNIQYYLLDKLYLEPLDELWWHAQSASIIKLNYDKEPREARSHAVVTKLGITREIDFYDATYDKYHSLESYKETQKIDGTTVSVSHYYDIKRDNYGRQTAYKVTGDIYGIPFTKRYWNITYDVLSRITDYWMDEDIDGTVTTYHYWNIVYNNLWQQSSYYFTVDDIEHFRSVITYNSYGLVASYMETYVEEGVTITTYRYNAYNENGLLSEYTEHILKQSDTVHEFWYVYVGNIIYNNVYAIMSFDEIKIIDTNATTITDYAEKIPALIDSFTFDGTTWNTSSGWADWGFNDTTTVYIEQWRGLEFYSVNSYQSEEDYYDLSIDAFRGRLSSYSMAKRTVTNTSDDVAVTNLP